jgi:NAD(P)-dependent dehydrogenase (short-subunit alcohol dehydrogenase family)
MSPRAGRLQAELGPQLAGQTAIVTGAAQGLGYAAAARLAADGAAVALFDRDEATLAGAVGRLAADGADAKAHAVDVSDEDGVRGAVESVLAARGRIDVLVNNAGIYPHFPFEQLTYADWRRVLATNLDSVYLCSHAVYPAMRERGYGRIVNVSSATFFIGYPGLIATEGVLGGEEAGLFDEIVPQQALGRRGEPEDIAECIAYLASPAASFITGQTINVDGGHRYH